MSNRADTMLGDLLIVEDEPDMRQALGDMFSWRGWSVTLAAEANAAMDALSEGFEGAVLVDIRLPGISGLEFIASVPEPVRQRTEFAIMTGHGDLPEAVTALRLGVRDFLRKPFSMRDVVRTVEGCLGRLRDRQESAQVAEKLKRQLERNAGNLRDLLERADTSRADTVAALVATIEHRASETAGHLRRMAHYVDVLAAELGYAEAERRELSMASRLHDIGKIGISDGILNKDGPLTEIEFKAVQTHTLMGHEILSRVENPIMARACRAALSHHECWDGSGYPDGLVGEAIPIEARLVAVADVYDTLRSERPYKAAMDHGKAVAVLLHGDGRTWPGQFDPRILTLFARISTQIAAIHDSDPDRFEPAEDWTEIALGA